MAKNYITHPTNPDFWAHEIFTLGVCWVCKAQTPWIYLDLGYQHIDCDMFPNEDGSRTTIINGREVN